MADTSRSGWSNEDMYVSKMNLRCEKHLKKQLDLLNKEQLMRVKSLEAEKRAFQGKAQRLNMNPENCEHLSQDTKDRTLSDQNKELNRLLKSLLHRPNVTGIGHSYIEYLSRNMQPLVKRPLQWGINPPLQCPKTTGLHTLPGVHGSERRTFTGQVKGQPVLLNQRAEALKRQGRARGKRVFLPPIGNKIKHREEERKPTAVTSSYRWRTTEDVVNGGSILRPVVTSSEENVSGNVVLSEGGESTIKGDRREEETHEQTQSAPEVDDKKLNTFVTDLPFKPLLPGSEISAPSPTELARRSNAAGILIQAQKRSNNSGKDELHKDREKDDKLTKLCLTTNPRRHSI